MAKDRAPAATAPGDPARSAPPRGKPPFLGWRMVAVACEDKRVLLLDNDVIADLRAQREAGLISTTNHTHADHGLATFRREFGHRA